MLVCAIGHDLAHFCADVHSIYMSLLCESVCEVLKFRTAAAHKIDAAGISWAACGPSTSGDGCVLVMECFLHVLLQEQVEQNG